MYDQAKPALDSEPEALNLAVIATMAQGVDSKTLAADLGFESAMLNLARIFKKDTGAEADIDSAIHWQEKAADTGNSPAMFKLGNLFERDLKVDPAKAEFWYKKADVAGHPDAKFRLAILYSKATIDKQEESPSLAFSLPE